MWPSDVPRGSGTGEGEGTSSIRGPAPIHHQNSDKTSLGLRNQDDRMRSHNKLHQRGASIMPQGALPYKYEEEQKSAGMTSLAGLPLYPDLASVLGLPRNIDRHLARHPTQGRTDPQMVLSLMLLALAGGDCVDDLKVLEADEGSCRILEHIEPEVSSSRWRTRKSRAVPSPSMVFRYLSASIRMRRPSGEAPPFLTRPPLAASRK
jgi:hypothetical protein